MLIYRPHRSSLAEAMKKARTFNSFEDIKNYVANEWNNLWGYQILNPDDIVLDEEFHDDRIGWEDVHYLCAKKLVTKIIWKNMVVPSVLDLWGGLNDKRSDFHR